MHRRLSLAVLLLSASLYGMEEELRPGEGVEFEVTVRINARGLRRVASIEFLVRPKEQERGSKEQAGQQDPEESGAKSAAVGARTSEGGIGRRHTFPPYPPDYADSPCGSGGYFCGLN